MEESTLRWPTDKEREEMEEVCSIDGVSHFFTFYWRALYTVHARAACARQGKT